MQTINDQSFGVMTVFKKPEGDFLFCVIEREGIHWSFPKGRPEAGESEEDTALRELGEETGITEIEIIPDIHFNQHYTYKKDEVVYDKNVKYFLGFVPSIYSKIPEAFLHEVSKVEWLPYKEAREILTDDNSKVLLDQVWEFIDKQSK